MPTRFSFHASNERMKRQFQLATKKKLQASYNIAGGDNAYVLTNESDDLQIFRWGFIPHWAKEATVGDNLTTTQAAGIATKLSFRMPIRQKRCLIFADSYYEWEKDGRAKKPYRVHLHNQELMAMAGVWDSWKGSDNKIIHTFALITVPPSAELQAIGAANMPAVINDKAEREAWLGDTALPVVLGLLRPLEAGALEIYPIAEQVNDTANNYPDLHKLWKE